MALRKPSMIQRKILDCEKARMTHDEERKKAKGRLAWPSHCEEGTLADSDRRRLDLQKIGQVQTSKFEP